MNKAIEIKDLTFSYHSNDPILDIASLVVETKEKVFIYGPSGSGKSTLLNLLAGVIISQQGGVTTLGQNFNLLSQDTRDRFRGDHIGYIFQSFNLIPYLSIYENIELPLKCSKLKSKKVGRNVREEISRLAKHLKIESILDKKVSHISIGQQQRVAVARALIGSPEVVIADEPTSSLDEEVTDSFMQLLLQEQRAVGFSLVFVSHDKRLAQYFDREISLSEINQRNTL